MLVKELDYKKEQPVYEKRKKLNLPRSLLCNMIFQEYERTVIFRLGRLLSGGARGPGVFFIIPCVDMFEKIDLRVQNFDVPPQEVKSFFKEKILYFLTCFSLALGSYNKNSEISYYLPNNQNEIFFLFRKFPLHFSLL